MFVIYLLTISNLIIQGGEIHHHNLKDNILFT